MADFAEHARQFRAASDDAGRGRVVEDVLEACELLEVPGGLRDFAAHLLLPLLEALTEIAPVFTDMRDATQMLRHNVLQLLLRLDVARMREFSDSEDPLLRGLVHSILLATARVVHTDNALNARVAMAVLGPYLLAVPREEVELHTRLHDELCAFVRAFALPRSRVRNIVKARADSVRRLIAEAVGGEAPQRPSELADLLRSNRKAWELSRNALVQLPATDSLELRAELPRGLYLVLLRKFPLDPRVAGCELGALLHTHVQSTVEEVLMMRLSEEIVHTSPQATAECLSLKVAVAYFLARIPRSAQQYFLERFLPLPLGAPDVTRREHARRATIAMQTLASALRLMPSSLRALRIDLLRTLRMLMERTPSSMPEAKTVPGIRDLLAQHATLFLDRRLLGGQDAPAHLPLRDLALHVYSDFLRISYEKQLSVAALVAGCDELLDWLFDPSVPVSLLLVVPKQLLPLLRRLLELRRSDGGVKDTCIPNVPGYADGVREDSVRRLLARVFDATVDKIEAFARLTPRLLAQWRRERLRLGLLVPHEELASQMRSARAALVDGPSDAARRHPHFARQPLHAQSGSALDRLDYDDTHARRQLHARGQAGESAASHALLGLQSSGTASSGTASSGTASSGTASSGAAALTASSGHSSASSNAQAYGRTVDPRKLEICALEDSDWTWMRDSADSDATDSALFGNNLSTELLRRETGFGAGSGICLASKGETPAAHLIASVMELLPLLHKVAKVACAAMSTHLDGSQRVPLSERELSAVLRYVDAVLDLIPLYRTTRLDVMLAEHSDVERYVLPRSRERNQPRTPNLQRFRAARTAVEHDLFFHLTGTICALHGSSFRRVFSSRLSRLLSESQKHKPLLRVNVLMRRVFHHDAESQVANAVDISLSCILRNLHADIDTGSRSLPDRDSESKNRAAASAESHVGLPRRRALQAEDFASSNPLPPSLTSLVQFMTDVGEAYKKMCLRRWSSVELIRGYLAPFVEGCLQGIQESHSPLFHVRMVSKLADMHFAWINMPRSVPLEDEKFFPDEETKQHFLRALVAIQRDPCRSREEREAVAIFTISIPGRVEDMAPYLRAVFSSVLIALESNVLHQQRMALTSLNCFLKNVSGDALPRMEAPLMRALSPFLNHNSPLEHLASNLVGILGARSREYLKAEKIIAQDDAEFYERHASLAESSAVVQPGDKDDETQGEYSLCLPLRQSLVADADVESLRAEASSVLDKDPSHTLAQVAMSACEGRAEVRLPVMPLLQQCEIVLRRALPEGHPSAPSLGNFTTRRHVFVLLSCVLSSMLSLECDPADFDQYMHRRDKDVAEQVHATVSEADCSELREALSFSKRNDAQHKVLRRVLTLLFECAADKDLAPSGLPFLEGLALHAAMLATGDERNTSPSGDARVLSVTIPITACIEAMQSIEIRVAEAAATFLDDFVCAVATLRQEDGDLLHCASLVDVLHNVVPLATQCGQQARWAASTAVASLCRHLSPLWLQRHATPLMRVLLAACRGNKAPVHLLSSSTSAVLQMTTWRLLPAALRVVPLDKTDQMAVTERCARAVLRAAAEAPASARTELVRTLLQAVLSVHPNERALAVALLRHSRSVLRVESDVLFDEAVKYLRKALAVSLKHTDSYVAAVVFGTWFLRRFRDEAKAEARVARCQEELRMLVKCFSTLTQSLSPMRLMYQSARELWLDVPVSLMLSPLIRARRQVMSAQDMGALLNTVFSAMCSGVQNEDVMRRLSLALRVAIRRSEQPSMLETVQQQVRCTVLSVLNENEDGSPKSTASRMSLSTWTRCENMYAVAFTREFMPPMEDIVKRVVTLLADTFFKEAYSADSVSRAEAALRFKALKEAAATHKLDVTVYALAVLLRASCALARLPHMRVAVDPKRRRDSVAAVLRALGMAERYLLSVQRFKFRPGGSLLPGQGMREEPLRGMYATLHVELCLGIPTALRRDVTRHAPLRALFVQLGHAYPKETLLHYLNTGLYEEETLSCLRASRKCRRTLYVDTEVRALFVQRLSSSEAGQSIGAIRALAALCRDRDRRCAREHELLREFLSQAALKQALERLLRGELEKRRRWSPELLPLAHAKTPERAAHFLERRFLSDVALVCAHAGDMCDDVDLLALSVGVLAVPSTADASELIDVLVTRVAMRWSADRQTVLLNRVFARTLFQDTLSERHAARILQFLVLPILHWHSPNRLRIEREDARIVEHKYGAEQLPCRRTRRVQSSADRVRRRQARQRRRRMRERLALVETAVQKRSQNAPIDAESETAAALRAFYHDEEEGDSFCAVFGEHFADGEHDPLSHFWREPQAMSDADLEQDLLFMDDDDSDDESDDVGECRHEPDLCEPGTLDALTPAVRRFLSAVARQQPTLRDTCDEWYNWTQTPPE